MITQANHAALDADDPDFTGSDGGETDAAPAGLPALRAALIGRDSDLQRLFEHFYQLDTLREPRLVTVIGEPGIGKSRLAGEFRQWIARLPDSAQFYSFQTGRQASAQPYSLIRQLVDALFRIRPDSRPAEARLRIERGVERLLGAGHAEKAHFIGQLAGYDFSASPHLRGVLADPRQLRDRALHYAIQCLAALTAEDPLVIVVDDFHEADDSSIDAVAQVVGVGRNLPLLVVCLAQVSLLDRRPGWSTSDPAGELIRLGPLDERDSRRLLGEILRKAGKLPAELRTLVVERAEGNPLFIEELIKMLIADGVIVPGSHQWQIQGSRLARLRVPGSLNDLLRARLGALSPAERDFLLRAAVVGRSFWPGAAAQLAGYGHAVGQPPEPRPPALQTLLSGLERAELIAPEPSSRFPGELEYTFRHELLHDVAYALVPAEQLGDYHRRTADWLIEHAAERADVYAALIAEHFGRAAAAAAAGHWHLRAGQYAAETYAVDTALDHFGRALASLPVSAETAQARIACHEGMAEAHIALARFPDALTSLSQARAVAAAAGDLVAEARACNGAALIYDNQVETRLAHASASEAIQLAERAGDADQLQLGLVRLAWAAFRLNRIDEALALGQRALAIAEHEDDQPGLARVRGLLGMLYEFRGDFAQAARYLEQALQIDYAIGNLRRAATHLNNLGFLANARGDFASAERFLREDLRLCDETGNRSSAIYALSNLGTTLNGLGRYAEAEVEARRGIQMCAASRMPVFSDFPRDLALACLGQGRVDEALEAAQSALDLARHAESPRELGAAWRALGLVIGQLGDPMGAPACFAESARILEEAGAATDRARTLREWAFHELRRGDTARGQAIWAEAHAIFAAAGLTHELARTPEQPPVE